MWRSETLKRDADRERLEAERQRLQARIDNHARSLSEMENVAAYVQHVRRDLDAITFAGRHEALDKLAVVVTVS